MTKKLLTTNEVSEILGISPKTIYDWAKDGKIPSVKLFSEIRFKQDVIDDIYENGLHEEERINNIVKAKPKRSKPLQRVPLWERKQEKLAG